MAVRVALGAGRGHLLVQALTEIGLLSGLGALLGLVIAIVGTRALTRLDAFALPLMTTIRVDAAALAVLAAMAVVAAVAIAVAPVLQMPLGRPQDSLRDATRGSTQGRRAGRMRGALVVSEVAFACAGMAPGFFRFAMYREWVEKSPVSPDIRPPIGANRLANKVPFTDDELADIIKPCNQLEDQRWGNRFGSGVWTGEDLKDFCWTLTFTGLRISDVVLFDIHRLRGNELFLRAKKNGGDVFTWIPDWLRDRLTARAARGSADASSS